MTLDSVPFTRAALADILMQLAEAVRSGDSLEGSFEYLLPTPEDVEQMGEMPPGTVLVRAGYRVGNLAGQGGFRTIGLDRELHQEPVTPAPGAAERKPRFDDPEMDEFDGDRRYRFADGSDDPEA